MVRVAADVQQDLPDCRFTSNQGELPRADYTLASGLFHVRLDAPTGAWERHIRETLDHMAEISAIGFAFNLPSGRPDTAAGPDGPYAGDPASWLNHCLRRFPRRVAMLHDYNLQEFTLLVRSRPL
jgi:hypothetical protein